MPTLVVPDPSLVALVGAAGSGKSTLAARHFSPDEVLSSDELRAAISGDPTDQAATRPAFAALHRSLARRLLSGWLTVVDATSVERHARRALVRLADLAGVPAVAIVLDLAPAIVLGRNASRAGRVVDAEIVGRQVAVLRSALDRAAMETEGWREVLVLRQPDEVERLRIERRAAEPAAAVHAPPPVTSSRPR